MLEVTRRFTFEAAHRLQHHPGKCRNLHGHHYVVELTMLRHGTAELGGDGMVLDFGTVKDIVGQWIDQRLDHGCFVASDDEELKSWLKLSGGRYTEIDGPTTVEQIAQVFFVVSRELFLTSRDLVQAQVVVSHVRVYETANCWADCP